MPIRIPVHTVVLTRVVKEGGKPQRVVPPIGKPFEFTSDEIKSISLANKNALRKPINEGGAEEPATAAPKKPGRGSRAAGNGAPQLPAPGQDPADGEGEGEGEGNDGEDI